MASAETTQVPLAEGRQERQLVAGRYRLAAFHRGDDTTEVWRALDESTNKVVSLEFLRARDPASKERFLAAGRRMASVEQPSVMRVAAVHDDPDGAFIVFEHLIHIPVPLDWLKPAIETPATIPTTPAASPIATPNAEAAAGSPPTPILRPAAPADVSSTDVAEGRPSDRGLSLLLFALRTRELSLIDTNLLTDSAFEFLSIAGAELKAVRFDPTVISDLRSFVRTADISALASAPARFAAALGRVATIRPHVRIGGPRLSRPRPVRAPRVKAVAAPKQPKQKEPRVPAAPRAPRVAWTGPRVRWGRVLFRGLSVGLIAAVLIAMPPELIGNLANVAGQLSGNVATVATEVTSAIGEKLASAPSVPSAPTLQRASFEVPPLSAYGAAFYAQAPYPTAHPNATVEWVVALRNTGSVGWYRGIDGAQASLALADGTTAGVQTTQYVGPGQVGWFVVHFAAPSQPGVAKVALLPRIDGRGRLPDLGIYASVTVSPNP